MFVLFLFFERRETHDDDDDELYCSRALAKDESRSHTQTKKESSGLEWQCCLCVCVSEGE